MTPAQAEQINSSKDFDEVKFELEMLKTSLDEKLDSQVELDYKEIKNLAKQAMEENPVLKAKIKVIERYGCVFKFVSFYAKTSDGKQNANAVFSCYDNSIYLFSFKISKMQDEDIKKIFSHEVEHAYKYAIHRLRYEKLGKQCHPLEYAVPEFSMDAANLAERLDRGDERVFKFLSLLRKREQNVDLTAPEKEFFEQCQQVSTGFKLRSHVIFYEESRAEYEQYLLKKDEVPFVWKVKLKREEEANSIITAVKHVLDLLVVKRIYCKESKTDKIGEHLPYAMVYFMLTDNNGRLNITLEMKERHARIVGENSRDIVECFYPEVLAYDEQDTAKAFECMGLTHTLGAESSTGGRYSVAEMLERGAFGTPDQTDAPLFRM